MSENNLDHQMARLDYWLDRKEDHQVIHFTPFKRLILFRRKSGQEIIRLFNNRDGRRDVSKIRGREEAKVLVQNLSVEIPQA